jgi:hypothetical protein
MKEFTIRTKEQRVYHVIYKIQAESEEAARETARFLPFEEESQMSHTVSQEILDVKESA